MIGLGEGDKIKKILFSSMIAALSMTSQAASAEEAVFTGPYVGIQAGAGRAESVHNDLDYWYYDFKNYKTAKTDVIAGVKAGYDMQAGAALIGVLGEVSFGKIDTLTEVTPADPSYAISSKTKVLGSLRAKLGVVSGNLAVFATGGWAFSDTTHSFGDTDGSNEGYSAKGGRSGSVFGLGTAYAISPRTKLGLDLSRYQFGTRTHEVIDAGVGTDYFFTQKDRLDTAVVSYTMSF